MNTYILENLDTCETFLVIASEYPDLSGDLLIDSDTIGSLLSFNFNLWSDENMTSLLATSEI